MANLFEGDRGADAAALARPVVETSSGKVAGLHDAASGQWRFLGIPYAEPPLGALRFKPPVAKRPWEGVLDAGRFGPAAPQIFDPCEGSYDEFTDAAPDAAPSSWVGSEDCLTVNLWMRPQPSGAPSIEQGGKRPVLVWIHGGANWLESSRLATYHGDKFVARADVIFVSLNYRLGVFGFLDLSGIGGEAYRGSHSNGLRDQALALRWIRDNIAAFGGDPGNITVMGESAGSIDISWHLTAGHLDGIARRVLMMSGVANLIGLSGDFNGGLGEAHGLERASDFLAKLGVSTMAELQALDTEAIMTRVVDIAHTSEILFDMDSLFWAKTSADFAPLDPFAAARAAGGSGGASGGGGRGIDVMIGCTGYEMGLWLFWDDDLDRHPVRWAADRLQHFTPAQRDDAARSYDAWFADEESGKRGMHLLGDSLFLMPTLWFAEEVAKRGDKVWLYQFDWAAEARHGALHAADQSFLFNKLETSVGQQLCGVPADAAEAASRRRLVAAMQDAVLAFAQAGDPNAHANADLPTWPPYDLERRAQMSFDRTCRIKDDPAAARRRWWTEQVYLPNLRD